MTPAEFRATRLSLGYTTQASLTEAIGVGLRSVQRWEGQGPVPSMAAWCIRRLQPKEGKKMGDTLHTEKLIAQWRNHAYGQGIRAEIMDGVDRDEALHHRNEQATYTRMADDLQAKLDAKRMKAHG